MNKGSVWCVSMAAHPIAMVCSYAETGNIAHVVVAYSDAHGIANAISVNP